MKPKLLIFLVIAVIGLSLAIGIVSYRAIANPTEQNWQPLSDLVPPEKLAEIVAENTAPSANREAIAASAIGYEQSGLLLVDFNTTSLCGVGGCALAGYQLSTGERILSTYTHTSGEPIVEVVERDGFELPCLFVHTTPRSLSQQEKDVLCYEGDHWEVEY